MAPKKRPKQRGRPERQRSKRSRAAAGEPRKHSLPAGHATSAVAGPAFPIVGMVASAGGLDAFKKFFSAMPPDSGIAFVLIPHLDPTHESLMVELIARQTKMPVGEATDNLRVEPNHVYIIPPNKYMTIDGGALRLTGPVERRGLATPIDLFLRSLAEDQQERAVCIILSGTGAHGTLGLRSVKANGGMAMVQEPASAEHRPMPTHAVATGLADFVLPPERLPEALVRFTRHFYVRELEAKTGPKKPSDCLPQILALIRARSKHDFSCYRKKMLLRRVERRMGLVQMTQMDDYLNHLRSQPDELKSLTSDLRIRVTNFFRDGEAFRTLQAQVLAPLVDAKPHDGTIRVWVPGCATGEEPYSLAILLLEQLASTDKACRVQVFASDVDEEALETGRAGLYPESIIADVTPERLKRYFVRAGDHSFQVNKQVREAVVFAQQDLIADAPFSKLDLITCRNLLIYLQPEIQKKIITLFHFALNDGGYLFLGPSETIGRQIDLFEPISKKWRIYKRLGSARRERVEFPIAMQRLARGEEQPPAEPGQARTVKFAALTQQQLLLAYAPAAVLINRKHEILYYFGPTSRYLDQPTGEPTQDLILMAREGLRSKLRVSVQKALRENQPVVERGVRVQRDGGSLAVTVGVRPVETAKALGLFLVTFADETEPVPARLHSADDDDTLVQHLEAELAATRQDLQSSVEELESSNEELKAANDEVMSINEGLQSTNEELETSKEELQSLNEELNTVNSQLEGKVEELENTTSDLANLLKCTDIGTIFLDPDLRIKQFTPAATRIANLIATDVGRPISDIKPKFADRDLLDDARLVLEKLVPAEKEVASGDGSWCIRRVVPYRTSENRIDGVVVTYVDITERKRSEDLLRSRVQQLEMQARLLGLAPLIVREPEGRILFWSEGAILLFGWTKAEAEGRNIHELLKAEFPKPLVEINQDLQRTGQWIGQLLMSRKDGTQLQIAAHWVLHRREENQDVMVLEVTNDITPLRQAERTVHAFEERFARFMLHLPGLAWIKDRDGRYIYVNDAAAKIFRRPRHELYGKTDHEIFPPEIAREFRENDQKALESDAGILTTERLTHPDGTLHHSMVSKFAIPGPDGQPSLVGGLAIDITDQQRAEAALRQSEAQYRALFTNSALGIVLMDPDTLRFVEFNDKACRQLGYSRDEFVQLSLPDIDIASTRAQIVERTRAFLQQTDIHQYETRHRAKDGTTCEVLVTGQTIQHGTQTLLYRIFMDVTVRKRAEQRLEELTAQLEQRISERTAALREKEALIRTILDTAAEGIVTIDEHGTILTFNKAAEQMFRYSSPDVVGQNVQQLMPQPYRDEHPDYLTNYLTTGIRRIIGTRREVLGRRKDGTTFPMDLAVSESRQQDQRLFTGIIRDISDRRRLEKQVLEIADQEQRRIGQDLHDSIGQELTGMALLAASLEEATADLPRKDAELAVKISAGLKRVLTQARLLSRGLIPVEIGPEGLMAALDELATRVREQGGVDCTFVCPAPVPIDDTVATHLYRIAQGAVSNALTHARANTITLTLEIHDGVIRLTIRDDGVGIGTQPKVDRAGGLKIMEYRAALINANLRVEPAKDGGTLVTCALSK